MEVDMNDPRRYTLEEYHENALGMRVAGGVLLTVSGLLWIFFFISERAGSMLMPAWAVTQTLVGFALLGLGNARENRAAIIEAEMATTPSTHNK